MKVKVGLLDDRLWCESSVWRATSQHIQRHGLTRSLLVVGDSGENRWANDIDGSALAAQPGKSQERPLKSPG